MAHHIDMVGHFLYSKIMLNGLHIIAYLFMLALILWWTIAHRRTTYKRAELAQNARGEVVTLLAEYNTNADRLDELDTEQMFVQLNLEDTEKPAAMQQIARERTGINADQARLISDMRGWEYIAGIKLVE